MLGPVRTETPEFIKKPVEEGKLEAKLNMVFKPKRGFSLINRVVRTSLATIELGQKGAVLVDFIHLLSRTFTVP